MANHFKLSYDSPSDTLYLDLSDPYEQQDSTSIAKGVLARINPKTNAVETLEVRDFVARFGSDQLLDLPIKGSLIRQKVSSANGVDLTRREYEVAQLVSQGMSNRKISEVTGLREQSIKNLVRVIMRKLNSQDRMSVASNLMLNAAGTASRKIDIL